MGERRTFGLWLSTTASCRMKGADAIPQTMPEVFLSYAREDAAIARQLVGYLQEEGWSVSWDREIPPGQAWEAAIDREIEAARCVVVLWSPAAVASAWVRAEAGAAAERGMLVPAIVEPTTLPVRFRAIQAADLVGWNGGRRHPGLGDLVGAVRALAGKEPTARPQPAEGRSPSGPARDDPVAVAEIETGEDRGRSLVLTEGTSSVTLGRGRDCDFVIDDTYASRTHCRLVIELAGGPGRPRGRRFLLIDSGSVVGTFVNGERVDRAELRDGDDFRIGGTRFRFRILGARAS